MAQQNGLIVELSRELKELAKEIKQEFKRIDGDIKSIIDDTGNIKGEFRSTSTHINWIRVVGGVVITAAAAAAVHFNTQLDTLGQRIATLEGKGGSYTSTERAIATAKSPEEVAANLDLLQAQIQKRAVSGDPLSSVELAQVGVTVSSTAQKYPDLPSVWSASSRLVNLRFDQTVPSNLPNCWDTYKGHSEDGTPPPNRPAPNWPAIDEQRFGNCELTLDDGAQFRDSGFGKAYEQNLRDFPSVKLVLNVHNAVVTYSGGKLIPYYQLICKDCVFRTSVFRVPAPQGQTVMRNLLVADTSNVQLAPPGQ